jgi:hypothetical protein
MAKRIRLSVMSYLIYTIKIAELSVRTRLTCVTLTCLLVEKLLWGCVFWLFRIQYLLSSANLDGWFLLPAKWRLSKTNLIDWTDSAVLLSFTERIVRVSYRSWNHWYLTFSVCTFCTCSTNEPFVLCFQIFDLASIVGVQVLAYKSWITFIVEWATWRLFDLLFVLVDVWFEFSKLISFWVLTALWNLMLEL